MSLFWRSWGLVVLLVSAVLAALVLLSTVQFSSVLTGFVQGRLAVLVQSAQGSFRSATRIGLPLAGVRNGTAILERARQTDPEIIAIHVFDPDGHILLSTDAIPPADISATALKAHARSHDKLWLAETGNTLLSGMSIPDAIGRQSIGGVVVVYPKAGLNTSVRAMGATLALFAAAIALIMSGLALMLMRFGLRRLICVFTGIDRTFTAFEQDEWRHAAGGRSVAPPPIAGFGIDTQALLSLFNAAEMQYVNAGRELAALETSGRVG